MNIFNKKIKGAAVDSLLLTFVQVVTTLLGIVVTKLLSTQFSLEEYGTYSQANLVISTASSLSILGLTNAANYFYNKTKDEEEQKRNISTIFSIQYIVGIICALLILAIQNPLISYFKNEYLRNILILVAIMPVFQNLIPMLQVLFVSIGAAKHIAIRNFAVSVFRLFAVVIACLFSKNVITIYFLLIILDIAQVIYFMVVFSRKRYSIRLRDTDFKLVPQILAFSIPMAVYVISNSLTRDIDKYIVSYFSDTETLAIYTNAAKILPFDLLTTSFITVLIPIITRQINSGKLLEAQNTFRSYLRFGYLVTWIVASGALVLSEELMVFLYDEKFLAGLPVFCIFIVVDMIRFANVTTVLSGAGKTRILMTLSIAAMIVNFILGLISYQYLGMAGTAISTLLVTLCLSVGLLYYGSRVINTNIRNLFRWKEILLIIIEILFVGGAIYFAKSLLYKVGLNSTLILIVLYTAYLVVMFAFNFRKIISSLREINSLK